MDSLYALERIDERMRQVMDELGLSVRKAAPDIGISPATVHRIANGGIPDVESFLRVKKWLSENEMN
jgi:predicted transcriptional regulator